MSALAVPVILKLTPDLAGILLSPEEFDAIEDADELYTYELVHGVLVVAPPPDVGEREPNDQLGYLLRFYKDHHPQGTALDLTLPEHRILTPDSRRRRALRRGPEARARVNCRPIARRHDQPHLPPRSCADEARRRFTSPP